MRRVVLDANVIISGTLSDRGHPATILSAWQDGRFSLVTTEEIIEDVKEVLTEILTNAPEPTHYPNLSRSRIGTLINSLRSYGIVTPGALNLTVVERDPDDDIVIIAAIEGAAEYIVTGDDDLLSLKKYREIKIITPAEFGKILS